MLAPLPRFVTSLARSAHAAPVALVARVAPVVAHAARVVAHAAAVVTTLALALAFAPRARAQLPDLVALEAQYLPGVAVDSAPDGAPVAAQVASYDAAINVPIALGATTFFVPGLAYHVDAVSYDAHGAPPPSFSSLRVFHALEVPLTLVQLLPDDWVVVARLAPGVAGDLRAFDTDSLRLSGAALATHTFGPRFTLGGGVLASSGFGTFLVLPALYVGWRPDETLRLEAFVPAFARVVVTPTPGLELSLRADVAGNTYAVRDAKVLAACTDGGAEREACMDHLAYSVVTAGAGVSVALFDDVWLAALGGATVYRRFEPFTRAHTLVAGGAQTLPNTWSVRVGLTWRLPE